MWELVREIPHSRFHSWDKTFRKSAKINFHRESFNEFAVTQCTTPTSAASKISFCGGNFCESPRKCKIIKSFPPEINLLYSKKQ